MKKRKNLVEIDRDVFNFLKSYKLKYNTSMIEIHRALVYEVADRKKLEEYLSKARKSRYPHRKSNL